jgi:prolyl oligopeptidase
VYAAKQADLLAGKPKWQRVIDYADEITGWAYQGNGLFVRTHKGASRSKIMRLDLAAPAAAATEVVAQSERVVTGIAAASDALYIEARDGNIKRLYKRGFAANAATVEVKLPIDGGFSIVSDEGGESACDPLLPGAILDLQSWVRARQIFEVKADGSVTNTGLQPQGPFDAPADLVATEVKVKSHDGAMVPMSIIHKKDVKLDGSNPTLLYGYGSYGITEEPFFSVGRLAWMDAGGVFAIANPRGTSVSGQDWYKAGFQRTKPNTWKDFIATTPAKLGILGGSAGGILVGRAMTDRPDLFAAVIPAVGALDGIRFESTPNGVPNIPEFGSVKTQAGFEALLAMSTYANIKDGVRYPAVLLTHGVNDPRVEVWQTTKAAARLMAAVAKVPNARPVLMRLEYDSGHGVGNTKKQQFEERADMYAFLLWQMGVKGFEL